MADDFKGKYYDAIIKKIKEIEAVMSVAVDVRS